MNFIDKIFKRFGYENINRLPKVPDLAMDGDGTMVLKFQRIERGLPKKSGNYMILNDRGETWCVFFMPTTAEEMIETMAWGKWCHYDKYSMQGKILAWAEKPKVIIPGTPTP